MRISQATTLLVGWLLIAFAGAANSASIFLTPDTTSASAGDQISLELWMDFSVTTIGGGGIDISYDPSQLSVDSWSAAPLGHPDFQRQPDQTPGLLLGISFGDFDNGVTGLNLVGTLTLTAGGNPSSGVTLIGVAESLTGAGPFVDLHTFEVIDVTYSGAAIHITGAPLPGSVWMLFGGLLALLKFRR